MTNKEKKYVEKLEEYILYLKQHHGSSFESRDYYEIKLSQLKSELKEAPPIDLIITSKITNMANEFKVVKEEQPTEQQKIDCQNALNLAVKKAGKEEQSLTDKLKVKGLLDESFTSMDKINEQLDKEEQPLSAEEVLKILKRKIDVAGQNNANYAIETDDIVLINKTLHSFRDQGRDWEKIKKEFYEWFIFNKRKIHAQLIIEWFKTNLKK